jgi:hypothetical protein
MRDAATPAPDLRTNRLPRDPLFPSLLATLALALAARCLLLGAHATEEDFFITLRYAQNIAAGHGFVYNPGERVLGTTTPLYTLLLALLIRLHFDPIMGGKLLSIGADLLSCCAVYSLGRTAGRPGAGLAAALCLALLPTNLIWATKGMEVEMVAAAAAVAWAAWAARRERLAWAAAAVLALLRIDGAVLGIIMLLATLARDRRLPWRGLLLYAGLLLPWLLYATAVFGSPIPASLQAKLIVYGRGQQGRFPRLIPFLTLMTHRQGLILTLGCLCALCALLYSLYYYRSNTQSQGSQITLGIPKTKNVPPLEWLLIPPALWMLMHYAGMALSKVFLFGWYFVPPTPIYYLVAMTGWSLLLQRMGEAKMAAIPARSVAVETHQAARYAAMTTVIGLALGAVFVPSALRDLRATQDVENRLRIPIGLWLRDHARPTDQVMLEPIGYIGYYSGLRVLDTVALVSPEVLSCYAPQVAMPYHEMWTRFQPDWMLLRAGEWNELQRYEATLTQPERLLVHYRYVRSWSDPSLPHSGRSFVLLHKISIS